MTTITPVDASRAVIGRSIDCAWKLLFFATGALVLWAALGPIPKLSLPSDKLDHIAAFLILTPLAALAFPRLGVWSAMGLSIVLGAGIECLQATPLIHRDADLWDWLADDLGAGIGSAALWSIRRALAHAK